MPDIIRPLEYTGAAQGVLAALREERLRDVTAYAQHLAKHAGHSRVTVGDVTTAILVADERFLPNAEDR